MKDAIDHFASKTYNKKQAQFMKLHVSIKDRCWQNGIRKYDTENKYWFLNATNPSVTLLDFSNHPYKRK